MSEQNQSEQSSASAPAVASGELLACPFCGGEADHTQVTNDTRIAVRFTVICIAGCGASGQWCDSKEAAAIAWNARTHSGEIASSLKEQLESVLSAAEDMHMEINEARGWKMKPSGAEREAWARTLDKAQECLKSLKPACPHCGSMTHPVGCCAQDGHGG